MYLLKYSLHYNPICEPTKSSKNHFKDRAIPFNIQPPPLWMRYDVSQPFRNCFWVKPLRNLKFLPMTPRK